jgi:short-subunit dehydrogenase
VKRIDFAGKLVVVAGASSGLGREIARVLACQEGADLVIAARRRDRLEGLKAEIEERCASRVHIVAVDLAQSDGARILFEEAVSKGEVFALVNSIGVTFWGKTLEAPIEDCEAMIAVNLSAVVKTSMLFLGYLLSRGRGALLTVTSASAFFTVPYQNLYVSIKHALQAFVEGLAVEYGKSGIVFSTFAPGGIATEMIERAGIHRKIPRESVLFMDAGKAARKAVSSFKRGKLISVPEPFLKLALFLVRLVPRASVGPFASRIFRP